MTTLNTDEIFKACARLDIFRSNLTFTVFERESKDTPPYYEIRAGGGAFQLSTTDKSDAENTCKLLNDSLAPFLEHEEQRCQNDIAIAIGLRS